MERVRMEKMIANLSLEIEEEDIGINLYSALYQNRDDLRFFGDGDRQRVVQILKKISEDSERHKSVLEKLIRVLGEKHRAN